MPDYDVQTGDAANDAWSSSTGTGDASSTGTTGDGGGDGYDPYQNVANANGMPPGVPGLPVGSTGQDPSQAPLGPRADAAPAPPGAIPDAPGKTPDAPASGLGAAFNAVKDFFTGNTTVGDYKGGGTPKTSTDTSRDPMRTSGQVQHDADEQARKQSTDAPPPSWWKDMF